MLRRTGISTIMVVTVASVAFAAGPPQLPIQQSTSPTGIVWAPGFSYDSATLVVSGPEGLVVREDFGSGGQLAYGLKDAMGAALADGSYTWQLTVRRTLTSAEQSALKAAREEAERLRVEATELRRHNSSGDLAGAITSDTDAKGGARFDSQQIEAADRAAEQAEMYLEALQDELEQRNGKFILRPSGDFVVEGGSATFHSAPAIALGSDPAEVTTGLKLDDAGASSSRSVATVPDSTPSLTPGLKTYFADDVETAGGICAGCASGTNPPAGRIEGDYFQSVGNLPFLWFDDSDGLSSWLLGQYTASDFKIIDWDNGQTPVVVIEELADANNLYIDSTGNIGLREAAPLTDLHITEFAPEVRLEDSSDSTFADIGYNSGNFYIQGNTNQSIVQVDGIAPFQSVVVASDSDVGLGGDPNAVWGFVDLHVDGREFFYSQILQLSTGGYSMFELLPPDFRLVVGPQETANPFTIPFTVDLTAPSDLLTLNPTGVAINGTTNAATLHVFESDSALHSRVMTRLEGSNFEPQFEYTNATTGKTWRLGSNPSGQFVINQTDDLGIAEMLITPDGVVRVNGTQVHPDYVFDSSYELMSLPELKEFVSANGHLPGVISAEQADGTIELTSLPLQMLEKIEELALYTIEQHEQIEAQQSVIDEQRQQNEAMRAENEALRAEMEQRLAAIEARLAAATQGQNE